jgi:hypothetical protein
MDGTAGALVGIVLRAISATDRAASILCTLAREAAPFAIEGLP